MNNTQKVLKNKHICEQATPNLGIEKVRLLAHLSPHNHKISLSYQRFERF